MTKTNHKQAFQRSLALFVLLALSFVIGKAAMAQKVAMQASAMDAVVVQ